jgi:hypothetical protein
MPVLSEASKLYLGTQQVSTVYLGSTKVWPPFTPAALPGLVTWLDAVDYTPGSWPNKGSGPAVTFVGSPHPTVSANTLNTKPTVRFTVSEGRIRSAWPYPPEDWTLLYLMRFIGPNRGRAFSVQYPPSNLLIGFHTTASDAAYFNGGWLYGPAGGGYFPATLPGPWKMYEADCDAVGNGQGFFIDGVAYGRYVGQAGQGFFNGWGLSGYDANNTQETMDMEVAELVIWNRRLSSPERIQIENYLRTKWGLA